MHRSGSFQLIGPSEARDLLRKGNVLVLDVRDAEAHAKGRIGNAVHVGVVNLASVVGATAYGTPVLLYCYRGYASEEYAAIFAEAGFNAVYSLIGGYEAWMRDADLAPGLRDYLANGDRPGG